MVANMEQESSSRSLELLETRQHLRKISGHLKNSLNKDKLIRQLRRKSKNLQKDFDQHVAEAKRQEKAHYIETAKIKLELIETRSQSRTPKPSVFTQANGTDIHRSTDKILTKSVNYNRYNESFGEITGDLQLLLEQAGIKHVKQLAGLSKQEIAQLADQIDRKAAE